MVSSTRHTSVAGLQAQSFALAEYLGNIATPDDRLQSMAPLSSISFRIRRASDGRSPDRSRLCAITITSQGTVSGSTVATFMAIKGDGFFSVQKATGITDNVPVFSGVTDYTRRGDFQVNANGNLVNGAGYYLMGVAVDPKTGNPLGTYRRCCSSKNNFVPAATSPFNTPRTSDHAEHAASTSAPAGRCWLRATESGDFRPKPPGLGNPDFRQRHPSRHPRREPLPAAITTSTTLSGRREATR